MRDIRFIQDAGRHVLVTGDFWVESYSDEELLVLGQLAYACATKAALAQAEPVPVDGLDVTHYEAVVGTFPSIASPLSPEQQSEAEMAGERG